MCSRLPLVQLPGWWLMLQKMEMKLRSVLEARISSKVQQKLEELHAWMSSCPLQEQQWWLRWILLVYKAHLINFSHACTKYWNKTYTLKFGCCENTGIWGKVNSQRRDIFMRVTSGKASGDDWLEDRLPLDARDAGSTVGWLAACESVLGSAGRGSAWHARARTGNPARRGKKGGPMRIFLVGGAIFAAKIYFKIFCE